MKYLYAFVGAGPATLAALTALPYPARRRSIILDQGRHSGRRICPELRSKSCSSCYSTKCHVTSGVGGASAVFGNKFCDFPASNGIQELMLDKKPSTSTATGNSIVVEHPNVPNRKVYPVTISRMDGYVERSRHNIAEAMETTEILAEFDVSDIFEMSGGGYSISSHDGREILTENVVVATGRSGHHSLRRWLSSLQIPFEENAPDIGVRIEVETSAINERFFYQDDPKFKFNFGGLGQGRTFCTCRGGMIVPVKFGSGFFADGAFAKKDSGRTNVALMARTHETHTPSALEDWCFSLNKGSDGTLLSGEFDIAGLRDDELVSQISDLLPHGPTPKYRSVLMSLVSKVVQDPAVRMFNSDLRYGTVRVYGPAIDRYWPKVDLAPGFRTAKPGVFVIGDAAGISRGILQAEASGRSWAATQCDDVRQSANA